VYDGTIWTTDQFAFTVPVSVETRQRPMSLEEKLVAALMYFETTPDARILVSAAAAGVAVTHVEASVAARIKPEILRENSFIAAPVGGTMTSH
jgi:hypothetical protein